MLVESAIQNVLIAISCNNNVLSSSKKYISNIITIIIK